MKLITRYAFEKDLTEWKETTLFDDGQAGAVVVSYDIYKGSAYNDSVVVRSVINKKNGRACTSKEEAIARYRELKGL